MHQENINTEARVFVQWREEFYGMILTKKKNSSCTREINEDIIYSKHFFSNFMKIACLLEAKHLQLYFKFLKRVVRFIILHKCCPYLIILDEHATAYFKERLANTFGHMKTMKYFPKPRQIQ